jgi:hypothetical protein
LALAAAALLCACAGAGDEQAGTAAVTDGTQAAATAALPDVPEGDRGATRLLPVDEADTSFAEFRRRALAALQERDTAFVYGILAPDIKSSFGGDAGRADFQIMWKLDQPDSSLLWHALTRVLTLGGKAQGDSFVAPYVFAVWPDTIDAFAHVAVTGQNVAAYAQPNATAPAMARLTHSILPVEEWQGQDDNGTPLPDGFARVRLPDGRSVWVRSADVYSPVGWRAFFEKREGRWIMTIFVAGD